MDNDNPTQQGSAVEAQDPMPRGAGDLHHHPVRRAGRDHDRFFFTYLLRELQRRRRQAMLTALGLAVGAGLVLTVTAASAGVRDAQSSVLYSLYGIGTNVTVTKAAPPFKPNSLKTHGASKHSGLVMLTVGNTVQHIDTLESPDGLGVLPTFAVEAIARLHGAKVVAGGLSLIDSKATVPSKSQLGKSGAPPARDRKQVSFTVDGVDPSKPQLGPFAAVKLRAGQSFQRSETDEDVAIVESSYASANRLKVGSAITIAHVRFRIIGIADEPYAADAAQVYIPLKRAQALAASPGTSSLAGKLDTIYVVAAAGADISALQQQIAKLLPGATVTTASSLASEVTGSLASATSLITDLGHWLAGAALLAAFLVAGLLSAAAVSSRSREFGTLKALGWSTRRVVMQIIGESTVIGIAGSVVGVAIGFGGAALIEAVAPVLAATVSDNPGSAPAQNVTFGPTGAHHFTAQGAQHTVPVHLTAPVSLEAIGLAVLLALLGAVIAGSLSAWRAARLSPVSALASVA
jgi:putative ABC transport system permease protein